MVECGVLFEVRTDFTIIFHGLGHSLFRLTFGSISSRGDPQHIDL
jgi:hypothetical protein